MCCLLHIKSKRHGAIRRIDSSISARTSCHSLFLTPIVQQLPAVVMVIFSRSNVIAIKTNKSARLAAASHCNPLVSPGIDQLYELMNRFECAVAEANISIISFSSKLKSAIGLRLFCLLQETTAVSFSASVQPFTSFSRHRQHNLTYVSYYI